MRASKISLRYSETWCDCFTFLSSSFNFFKYSERYLFLTAVFLKNQVFWNKMQCYCLRSSQCFEGTTILELSIIIIIIIYLVFQRSTKVDIELVIRSQQAEYRMSHYNVIHIVIIIIIIIIIIVCNYNTEISQIQYIQRNAIMLGVDT